MSKYPDLVVTPPADANLATLRNRVEREFLGADMSDELAEYVSATASIVDFTELYQATRAWVAMTHDLDVGAATERAMADALPTGFGSKSKLAGPMPVPNRWQYAVVNTGTLSTQSRLAEVLGVAGAHGWELVTVYDKASNWVGGMEKGFALMKRPVPDGVVPDEWCVQVRG